MYQIFYDDVRETKTAPMWEIIELWTIGVKIIIPWLMAEHKILMQAWA